MELPEIGDHCALAACKQLDFLPFQCNLCGGTFCQDHRTPDSHTCPNASTSATSVSTAPTGRPLGHACAVADCGQLETATTICVKCRQHLCLAHRHPHEHACPSLDSQRTYDSARTERTAAAEAQHKSAVAKAESSQKKKKLTAKGRATAAKVALMKMKTKATGDKSIPMPKRVYLEFQTAGSAPPAKSVQLFLNQDWPLGKAVDRAVASLSLPNAGAWQAHADSPSSEADADPAAPLPLNTPLHDLSTEIPSGSTVYLTISDH